MVEWVLEPLQYGFFQRGLMAGLIVAFSCGVLSAFIVWRGMAFIGDALAHAVLPGIVISIILGIHVLIGALAAAMLSVVGIGALTRRKGFKEDTAIGVIFAGAFALGILLMSKVATFKDLSHILFGNILGVSSFDVILILSVGVVVVIGVYLFYKELLVTSFDPTHAQAIGLSPQLIHFGLLFLVAATTVLATQTVGVVLVMALLVTPAAAASLLARKLSKIISLSICFSMTSILFGFYISYYFDLASGATIVLVLTLFFLLSLILSKIKNRP
ncbi:metal ABC transporter permease [Oceanispirochaeta sp.]|jgi:ABC-type Mn2+/Zn2+ transport system permease subunit|uniref:metal ABC transporter permease n=1 Tax=Oceanispirochaeta sp. TaxID=2035350 RepID=UPI002622B035|nr:metal ABC transporter permease [Oceanispirochaeta sp.]MDA3957849.1 metal ABC transporter permease [Oceanispirochaeta sp.]